MMRCSNCGKTIPDQSKFCAFCGATQQSRPAAPPAAASQPGRGHAIIRPWIIVMAIVVVAVLILMGAVGLRFLKSLVPQGSLLPTPTATIVAASPTLLPTATALPRATDTPAPTLTPTPLVAGPLMTVMAQAQETATAFTTATAQAAERAAVAATATTQARQIAEAVQATTAAQANEIGAAIRATATAQAWLIAQAVYATATAQAWATARAGSISPEQAVRYYTQLIQERQYTISWRMLSNAFNAAKGFPTVESYARDWDESGPVTLVGPVDVIETGDRATVTLTWYYSRKDVYHQLRYQLVRDYVHGDARFGYWQFLSGVLLY